MSKRLRKSYERFHEKPVEKYRRVSIPETPKEMMALGEAVGVLYKIPGERTPYLHKFRAKKPTLATDARGRRLYFVGGSYRVTSRGIVG